MVRRVARHDPRQTKRAWEYHVRVQAPPLLRNRGCELRSCVVTTMISLESDVAARILHEHGFHANFFFPSLEL